jgi:hypothetical protein
VLDNQDWSDNFDKRFFKKTTLANASDVIKEAYQIDTNKRYSNDSLEYVKQLDKKAKESWLKF